MPAARWRAPCRSTTCLWIGAILQSVSNLVFVWLAQAGTNTWALTAAVIAENFTGAIGTVIFVAYLSALCKNPLHTATQFALLTALSAFGRTYLSAGAGFVAAGGRLADVLYFERGRRDPELHPAGLAAGARAFQEPRDEGAITVRACSSTKATRSSTGASGNAINSYPSVT